MKRRLAVNLALCLACMAVGVLGGRQFLPRAPDLGSIRTWQPGEYRGELATDLQLFRSFATRSRFMGPVGKGNALAAAECLSTRRLAWGRSIAVGAWVWGEGGDGTNCIVMAAEMGKHRNRLVLLFEAQDDDCRKPFAVRVVYHRDPYYDMGVMGGVRAPWIGVARDELIRRGDKLPDGSIVVADPQLGEHPDWLLIPDGEVAVGLQYPDGSYSNFVPLRRLPRDRYLGLGGQHERRDKPACSGG